MICLSKSVKYQAFIQQSKLLSVIEDFVNMGQKLWSCINYAIYMKSLSKA